MTGIRKIHHVGIIVGNMEKSLLFYTEILGLKVQADYISEGKLVSSGVGLENASIRAVFLKAGDGEAYFELLQYNNPTGRITDSVKILNNDFGIRHITFEVSNIEEIYYDLKSKGVEFIADLQHLEDGNSIAYFYDYDGNILELFQAGRKM